MDLRKVQAERRTPVPQESPSGGGVSECWSLTGYQRKVERPWAHNLLKILGSEVPRSTAVLCTDSLVARPRGTKVRREVVLIRVLNSLGGNKD